ncbi:MAG: hypothetical protein AAGU73_07770 [Actinomycetota bacterium]
MIGLGRWALAVLLAAGMGLGSVACASVEEQRAELREGLEAPALAVFDLAAAAEAGDVTGVRTYMDSTAVAVSFARAIMDIARADDEPGSNSGHADNLPVGKMEQTYSEQFTADVLAAVENGTLVAEGTVLAAILDEGPGAVEYVGDDEALVSVDVPVLEGAEAHTAHFRMVRTGDRWMLIAVEDTTDLYGLFFGAAE